MGVRKRKASKYAAAGPRERRPLLARDPDDYVPTTACLWCNHDEFWQGVTLGKEDIVRCLKCWPQARAWDGGRIVRSRLGPVQLARTLFFEQVPLRMGPRLERPGKKDFWRKDTPSLPPVPEFASVDDLMTFMRTGEARRVNPLAKPRPHTNGPLLSNRPLPARRPNPLAKRP